MSYRQWRETTFGDPYLVWHDGPDFTTLLASAAADPETVAGMLATGLHERDSLAAESIATLAGTGLTPSNAMAELLAVLPTASGTFLVRVAQALHTLTGDESWSTPIVGVLKAGRDWGHRMDAAIALAGFARTPELVDALGRAVRDRQYLVRYHAANTLLRYAGDTTQITVHRELFDLIKGTSRQAWRTAAQRLTASP
jgi:hypothetical protein